MKAGWNPTGNGWDICDCDEEEKSMRCRCSAWRSCRRLLACLYSPVRSSRWACSEGIEHPAVCSSSSTSSSPSLSLIHHGDLPLLVACTCGGAKCRLRLATLSNISIDGSCGTYVSGTKDGVDLWRFSILEGGCGCYMGGYGNRGGFWGAPSWGLLCKDLGVKTTQMRRVSVKRDPRKRSSARKCTPRAEGGSYWRSHYSSLFPTPVL